MGLVTVDMTIPHKRVRTGNSSVCIYLVVSSLTLLWCNNLHWVHFLCFSVQKGSSVYLPSGWINFQPFSRITFQGVSLERNRGGKKSHIPFQIGIKFRQSKYFFVDFMQEAWLQLYSKREFLEELKCYSTTANQETQTEERPKSCRIRVRAELQKCHGYCSLCACNSTFLLNGEPGMALSF